MVKDVAIFIAFASLNAQKHASAVDLGNLEAHAFQEPQATGVDDTQAYTIGWTTDLTQYHPDLVGSEHNRE